MYTYKNKSTLLFLRHYHFSELFESDDRIVIDEISTIIPRSRYTLHDVYLRLIDIHANVCRRDVSIHAGFMDLTTCARTQPCTHTDTITHLSITALSDSLTGSHTHVLMTATILCHHYCSHWLMKFYATMWKHTHIHTHSRTHTCTHTHIYIYVCTNTHIHHTHIHTHSRHIHTPTYRLI